MIMNNYIIESVLGFDFDVEIKDKDGNIISKGTTSSVIPTELPEKITVKVFDKSFFTHFNEELLNKIRQHRRLND